MANSLQGLAKAYKNHDLALMHTQQWDDTNPHLVANKIKVILEHIDPLDLSKKDRFWWHEILWFWYHHAISCAIWKRKSRSWAQFYADRAMTLQTANHPNKITKLLWLLVYDRLAEAKWWAAQITGIEAKTAQETIREYERGEFFK
ncbi:MAG: hypothetical protein AAB581_03210 [Patescibacteria group bacterium]